MHSILRVLPFKILNVGGGRGFENGVLVFDCPACGDRKGRGYLSVYSKRGGCFRARCELQGSRPIKDYLSILLDRGLLLREQASDILLHIVGAEHRASPGADTRPERARPFVKLPGSICALERRDLPDSWRAVKLQWASRFGFCRIDSHYGRGILIPVTYRYQPCFYTIRLNGGGYMAATRGESSHGKSDCLFGYDYLPTGAQAVAVVESAQDAVVMMEKYRIPSVALLGSMMSYEQRRLLLSARPRQILVALDADAQDKSAFLASELMRFFQSVRVATWIGAKDAAQGGTLRVL